MHVIFYHPLSIQTNATSGSSVRVSKILSEFQNHYGNENVFLISGSSSEKNKQLKELRRLIKSGIYFSYAYAENANFPSILSDSDHLPRSPLFEYRLFHLLKRHKIPVGLFYRDVYWKQPEFTKLYKFPFGTLLKMIFKFEFYLYQKSLDCLFLPDVKMSEVLKTSSKLSIKPLPPGIECKREVIRRCNQPISKLLYIGGISKPLYDLSPLFCFLHNNPQVQLTLCCRESEFKAYKSAYNIPLNVTVVHKSGRELDILYSQSDAFITYRAYNNYHDITLPVKVYETAGQGIPQLIYGKSLDALTVVQNSFGISFQHDDELLELLRNGFNESTYEEFDRNVLNNTWKRRVEFIENTLANRADFA